jgi:hypothetical protein
MRARSTVVLSLPLLAMAWGCSKDAPPSPTPAPPATTEADRMRPLPSPLPPVAGRVNGQDIPIRNVAIMVEESIELGKVSEARRNALYRDALDQLIRRELLLQEAQARGVKADDLEVQRTYDRMRGPHKDEEAWRTFLKSRSLDDDTLRAEIRIRHTVEALLAQEAAQHQVSATDEEMRALYDATDASKFQPPGASPGPKPPFESVQEVLRQQVMRRKHMEASERFVDSIKARAKVEKFL